LNFARSAAMNISRPEVAFVVQIRFVKVIVASFCAVLFAFAASADDFRTIDGKEYKNVTVSRVEPDGIVITFSRGIVKLPFAELSPEIQKKYGYDEEQAKAFAAKIAQDQQDIYLQTEAEKERQAKIREAEQQIRQNEKRIAANEAQNLAKIE
jgi:hypothetical protein